MNVIDLVRRKGIEPRKASTAKGGEYHSSCPIPGCGDGGKGPKSNRFHVWPEQNDGKGSWWCRQCNRGGDNIALLMVMDGMSYKEACAALGVELSNTPCVPVQPRASRKYPNQSDYKPSEYQKPADKWREHAGKFAAWAQDQLVNHNPEEMNKLADRGVDPGTVLRWGLGWNPGDNGKDLFRAREAWGLETIEKKDGRKKPLWIPRGLVIPYRRDGVLQRIRIRRPKAHLRSGDDARYYVLPGSSAMPWIIGERRRAYVVVETELDGLLVDQECSDLVGVLSLGSSSNMPDDYCHSHLASALVILNSLDYDQAGAKSREKWRAAYQQTERWPVPTGKDPGDAYKVGVNIRQWVLAGLPPAWHVGPSPFIAKGLEGVVVEAVEKRTEDPPAENQDADLENGQILNYPESVRELGDLLRRSPVRIINTAERTGLEAAMQFKASKACGRISDLVFRDKDCWKYIMNHPEEIIDGRNYYA